MFFFDKKPTFSAVLCAQDLNEYGEALDELLEDFSYSLTQFDNSSNSRGDVLGVVQRGLWDEDTKQVIVEMVKEQVMARLRETLGFASDAEINEVENREDLDEGEIEKLKKKIHHLENDLTERLEKLRKKIA